jgi:hypothetical protein
VHPTAQPAPPSSPGRALLGGPALRGVVAVAVAAAAGGPCWLPLTCAFTLAGRMVPMPPTAGRCRSSGATGQGAWEVRNRSSTNAWSIGRADCWSLNSAPNRKTPWRTSVSSRSRASSPRTQPGRLERRRRSDACRRPPGRSGARRAAAGGSPGMPSRVLPLAPLPSPGVRRARRGSLCPGRRPRLGNRVGRRTAPNTSVTCPVGRRRRMPWSQGRRCWPLLAGRGQAQQSRTAVSDSGRCWFDLPE